MSEERSINDLPPEVLTKIFRYLDQESLGKATLTCRHWKEVIEDACRWKILIYISNWTDLPEIVPTVNHKYSESEMHRFFYTTNRKFSEITHADNFIEIIKCMPNVRHVKLFDVGFPTSHVAFSSTVDQKSLPEFAKLKILEAKNCSLDSIRCFKRSPNLSEFVLRDRWNETIKHTVALEFLQSQNQLKSLVLFDIGNTSALLQPGVITNDSVKCQLSQLYFINFSYDVSQQSCSNLLGFLEMQAKSVEILRLRFGTPNSVYEFVFSKFENLKSLQLPIAEIGKEKELLKRLKVNKNINKLFPLGSAKLESQCMKEFIRCVPNVIDLTLDGYYKKEMLEIIANNLTKLTRVMLIGTRINHEYSGIRFHNLKTLRILNFDRRFDWEKFTKLNPITKLVNVGFSAKWKGGSSTKLCEALNRNMRLTNFRNSEKYARGCIPNAIGSSFESAVKQQLMSRLPKWFRIRRESDDNYYSL
ncbi:hypothetical protein Bhyg_09250, partial [Pseudolycoriella hygida]